MSRMMWEGEEEEEREESGEYEQVGESPRESPQSGSLHPKERLFSSPIHIAEFAEMQKQENGSSPDIFIEFSNSFRRIVEHDNESEGQEEVLDIMGHPIGDFELKMEAEDEEDLPQIEEDKENSPPTAAQLATPLKIRKPEVRSPLQDITPSMTQRKQKTTTKMTVSAKRRFLTPRTMEKSGLATSGLRRIDRF